MSPKAATQTSGLFSYADLAGTRQANRRPKQVRLLAQCEIAPVPISHSPAGKARGGAAYWTYVSLRETQRAGFRP